MPGTNQLNRPTLTGPYLLSVRFHDERYQVTSQACSGAPDEVVPPIPTPIGRLADFLSFVSKSRHKMNVVKRTKPRKASQRRLSGFVAFKAYYAQYNNSGLRMVDLNKRLNYLWHNYEYQDVWERYVTLYNSRQGRSETFLEWLRRVPKAAGSLVLFTKSQPRQQINHDLSVPRPLFIETRRENETVRHQQDKALTDTHREPGALATCSLEQITSKEEWRAIEHMYSRLWEWDLEQYLIQS